MLIVTDDGTYNFENIVYFCKEGKYSIFLYSGNDGKFNQDFESEGERDQAYDDIITCYQLERKMCNLTSKKENEK